MKKIHCFKYLLLLILLVSVNNLHAQLLKAKELNDSNYYEVYPEKLALRLYVGQKFTQFMIPSSGAMEDVEYRANHKFNLGVGASWHHFSLNIGYGFSTFNKEAKARGKTKGFNFQFHLYPRKWAIDLMLVMPKGMYLHPKGYAAATNSSYYYRPDVKESLFGLAAYRMPNKEKFSYRAAISQNDWQKRSAGTPLYGGEVSYGKIEGDSALVPQAIQSGFPQAGITEMRFISIGPGIGYAYTAVISQHFYIMVSLIANLKVNMVTEEKPSGDFKKTSVAPSAICKAGIGYNSDNWSFGGHIMGNAMFVKGAASSKNYIFPTGIFRIQVAKKFDLKKKK